MKNILPLLILVLFSTQGSAQETDSITSDPIFPLVIEPKGFDHIKIVAVKADPHSDQGFGLRLSLEYFKGNRSLSKIDIYRESYGYSVKAQKAMQEWYQLQLTEEDADHFGNSLEPFVK